MKQLFLIINPYSGRGVSNYRIGDIVGRFAANGYAVTVMFTKRGQVRKMAADFAADYDLVVVSGGDGTLSDVLTGLAQLKYPPPVGYIPSGTANDMAATLGLSHQVSTAVETILSGNMIPYDLGRFGEDYFSYVTAFGAFTSVSYATSQSSKKALGHLAYVIGGAAELSQIKPRHTRIEYDGGYIEDDLLFGGVTNSTSVAGLVHLDPSFVDLGDGMFEILLVRRLINAADFVSIIKDITTKRFDSDVVRIIHSPFVHFHFDTPVAWTRDGEPGGEHTDIEITNIRHAVRIIVPPVRTETS